MGIDSDEVDYRVEIAGTLDRHQIEGLQLELRRLAKRVGVAISGFRVETREATASNGSE